MGVVYLARHTRLDRQVALKVFGAMPAGGAVPLDSRGRARFDREAAVAARLEHPDIVPIYDRSAPDDEIPWISMRYISGGDIVGQMAEAGGRLRAPDAVQLIADAGHALDYAHRRGVLHRDVKPANILVDLSDRAAGHAVLTDFGIARAFDDTLTLTGTTATVAYAAPERFGDTPADHRADIYSLGCTLFETITGSRPFPRPDQAAVISAHLTARPPRPTELVPDLPRGFDDVIATAMAKDPDDRYPDCTTLAEAALLALDAPQRPARVSPVRSVNAAATIRSVRAPAARPPIPAPGTGSRSGEFRERVIDFVTFLAGLLSVIAAILLTTSLIPPFVRVHEVDRTVAAVLHEGGYYLVCLAVIGWIGGALAGTRILIPELPREVCGSLIIGTASTGIWSIAVLLRLNDLWSSESKSAAGQPIHGAAGEEMAVLGIAALILAGVIAGIALLLGDPPPLAIRIPRDAYSIITLLLSLAAGIAMAAARLPTTDAGHFLRNDYTWLTIWAAALAALPALASFLLPHSIFRGLALGTALGNLAICVFLHSEGQSLATGGVATGAALGLIIVNAVALTETRHRVG